MQISVIIPTLNEEAVLEKTLSTLRERGQAEVIVVDGGSKDQTQAIARRYADRLLSSPPGRARQMNLGAEVAKGEVLLFLHADTLLPEHFTEILAQTLSDPSVVGGRFDVKLDGRRWIFRVVETLISFRSRLTRTATGDQAIFIRRQAFFALGKYPEVPLMEDIALSRKMKRAGRVACLRECVVTSSRRWEKNGVLRTIVLMWVLKLGYFAGIPPARLKAFYADTR